MFYLWWGLGFTLLTVFIYNIQQYNIWSMLYFAALVIYLIDGSLYLLTTFIQYTLLLVTTNMISFLLVCSWNIIDLFSSVQSLSHVWLFATSWIAARQASLSITNSRSSLRLTSIESVMPSSHLNLCCPLFLLPPIPPNIRPVAPYNF